MATRLELTRAQILAFRRRVGALEERLPLSPRSLRTAAWAGLQDSVPRAALLSIHARVEGAHPDIWDDNAFVQVWGPRWATYVVPAYDHAIFTVGRHPDTAAKRERAESWAARIAAREPKLSVLSRYAATTGSVLIRWDGARAPDVWTVPRPAIEPLDARRELARRYVHVFGPGTSVSFANWAGVTAKEAKAAWEGLDLIPVTTPLGEEWILAADETAVREPVAPSTAVRLLPSGDAYWLAYDDERRRFLVPDARSRAALWTPRVWPGALLVSGELAGTWRRQQTTVSVDPWRRLTSAEREALDAEIASLPLSVA